LHLNTTNAACGVQFAPRRTTVQNLPPAATHLNFDGNKDYVVLPLDNTEVPTTNFTHEFWFKTTDANGTMFAASTGPLAAPSGWD
jgi:hypothetical protein